MPRILKRPMFNRGGSSNQGIMDGLVDRRQYELGAFGQKAKQTSDDVYSFMKDMVPPPKTRLPLGSLGADLLSGKGFRDSAINAYGKFTEADDAKQNYDRQLRMQAAGIGVKDAMTKNKDAKSYQAIAVAEELGKIIPQIYVLEEQLKKDPNNQDLKMKLDVLKTKRTNFSKTDKVTEATLKIFAASITGQQMFESIKEGLLRDSRADGSNKYKDELDPSLNTDAIQELRRQLGEFTRTGSADGGRIGLAAGGMDMMPMQPEPRGNPGVVTEESGDPISYDQLRARLPQQITDDIVQLMSVSSEALEDFANISNQQEVDNFNKKYNVNLVLPSEE